MNLKIISGTDRPNSHAIKISKYVSTLYKEMGIKADVISLEDFPIHAVVGGKYGHVIPEVDAFIKPIVEADALVFVIPEYNGSYPGILKLFVDYLPFPKTFEKMPMAFIGEATGAFGGLRAVEQFQMVANYRNALLFSERVFIQRVHNGFHHETGLRDKFAQGLLESQVINFARFVKALNTF